MRLIQLQPNGSADNALDFHPMVTVVEAPSKAAHERLVSTLRALPRGDDPGCGGLVEAHGVLLDLSPQTLALLDLHTDLDVLVGRADIPGAPASGSVPGAARTTVEHVIAETPVGRHPELDRARRGRADAAEALSILKEAAERSRVVCQDAQAELDAARAALEAATVRAAEPPSVGEDASADAMSEAAIAERRAELEAEIAEHEAELTRVERGLEELSSIDTRPIQVLLDAIRNPAPVDYVPSERGQELADEFVELQAQVAELEDGLERRGRGPATAMQRLEDARVELGAAERAMAKPQLSPTDVEELEAAHEEVLEAEAKTSGLRRRGGQKRLDEAMARQQAILDRVGFPTWSSYVMGASLLGIDPRAEQRLEQARFELEAAESDWASITTEIEADPHHSALLDQLEAVYLEAFDLLGGDDDREDIESALRNLQVARREVTTEELCDALVYQLELVGLPLGANAGLDYTVVVADTFLEEAAAIDGRIAELGELRTTSTAGLEQARVELDALESASGAPAGGGDDLADVIDLTAARGGERFDEVLDLDALDETAGADGARGGDAPDEIEAADIASLEAAVADAEAEHVDAAEALEAREALVDAATQVEAVAAAKLVRIAGDLVDEQVPADAAPSSDDAFDVDGEAGPEAVEFYLLSRLAAQRNVSFAGSVPLVLDDALASLPPDEIESLLAKLERMSEAVQIVYLTSDPRVVTWASGVGITRAAVVHAPPSFG